jgi:large subunit ribosomal protein L22
MKAILKNYRQSPRKVRLVADVIRGKKVNDALNALRFVEKRAAEPVAKVIRSAVANAVQAGNDPASLRVSHVSVDKGVTQKRFMPRARGSASRINKRSSHITVTLSNK